MGGRLLSRGRSVLGLEGSVAAWLLTRPAESAVRARSGPSGPVRRAPRTASPGPGGPGYPGIRLRNRPPDVTVVTADG
ncbi:hypothetical protein GCM10010512_36920 [Streptomyces thermoviolaceus subsp. thermoviolaceus]|nr:hypothetical protein GCM10010499_31890 [Streptomyces thermoviolaceus subsp. apingens]GHB02149.1 hypothetical protein GCM10010512_36920 [Streptomyces thermoviolaceus subsp. thermoviolaceus]